MEPQDVGGTVEGAEHQGDAPVLADVGMGLDARATDVQVGHRAPIENAEGLVVALGRDVHRALRRQGGGGDEGDQLVIQLIVDLGHGRSAPSTAGQTGARTRQKVGATT